MTGGLSAFLALLAMLFGVIAVVLYIIDFAIN